MRGGVDEGMSAPGGGTLQLVQPRGPVAGRLARTQVLVSGGVVSRRTRRRRHRRRGRVGGGGRGQQQGAVLARTEATRHVVVRGEVMDGGPVGRLVVVPGVGRRPRLGVVHVVVVVGVVGVRRGGGRRRGQRRGRSRRVQLGGRRVVVVGVVVVRRRRHLVLVLLLVVAVPERRWEVPR